MNDDQGNGAGEATEPPTPGESIAGSSGPPVPIELVYRSRGAFLMAYATNLARGGLFLETPDPFATGTVVSLRFSAPSLPTAVAVDGVVTWSRPVDAGPGQPPGMGIAIAGPPDALGEAVDQLAYGFTGMKVLLAAGEPAPRAILSRYLRSILQCEIIEADAAGNMAGAAGRRELSTLDLVVIDLDSSGPQGFELFTRLRGQPHTQTVPALALAHIERDRAHALRVGFEDAQANPPVFADLQAAVLRCLARPVSMATAAVDSASISD